MGKKQYFIDYYEAELNESIKMVKAKVNEKFIGKYMNFIKSLERITDLNSVDF